MCIAEPTDTVLRVRIVYDFVYYIYAKSGNNNESEIMFGWSWRSTVCEHCAALLCIYIYIYTVWSRSYISEKCTVCLEHMAVLYCGIAQCLTKTMWENEIMCRYFWCNVWLCITCERFIRLYGEHTYVSKYMANDMVLAVDVKSHCMHRNLL